MLFSPLPQSEVEVDQAFERLTQAIIQLNHCSEVEPLLRTGVQQTRHLFESDRSLICRSSSGAEGTVVAEAVGKDWLSLLGQKVYLPQSDAEIGASSTTTAFVALDCIEDSKLNSAAIASLTRCQVRAYLATPIWINAPPAAAREEAPQLWGWLVIHRCRSNCSWRGVHGYVLQQIATQIGATLERLQLQEQIEAIQTQATAAIEQTETKYQLATRACSIGVWDWDLHTNAIYLDPLLKEMLGYRDHEIRNHIDDWVQYVYAEDLPQVMAAATEHLEGRSPEYRIEHRMVHRDGSLRWVLAQGSALRSADGTPYRMVGTDIDITERKTAELALEKQTQQERAFNEVVQSVRSSLDLETIFMEAAASISASLKVEVAIVQYLPLEACWRHQVVYDRGTRQVAQRYVDVPEADNPFAERLKRLEVVQIDNTDTITDAINRQLAAITDPRAWLIVPISVEGSVWGSLTLGREDQPLPWLTDEVQLAQRVADQLGIAIHQASLYQQIQAAHERDKLVLHSIGEGIWDWDPNEDVILDSDRYWEILGYNPQTQGLSNFPRELARIYPDERDRVRDTAYRHLSTGEPFAMEFRMQHRQGHYLWIRARGQAVWDDQGHPVRMLGTIEDISDRKQAEFDLEQSRKQREEEFRTLAENSPDGIFRVDTELRLQYVNPIIEKLLAMPRPKLLGKTITDLGLPDASLAQWQTMITETLKSGQERQFETQETLPAGIYSFQSRVVPERNAQGYITSVLVVSRDITSLKQAQTALLRSLNQEHSLRMITQHMRETLNLDAILATAVTEVQQVLNADRTLIFQLTSNHSGIVIQESVRPEYPTTLEMRWEDEHFPPECCEFYRQGQGRIVADITQDDWGSCLTEFMQSVGVQSKMVAPITQNQPDGTVQVWGLMITHACATRRRWDPEELELLQQVAQQLAIALQQSELHQQLLAANRELEHLSSTDGLTKLVNRRQFDNTLAAEWQRAQREQRELTLILCDIDYFKQYNDTYGHPAGDECLIAVAQALQHCVNRATDCVARYGGEEFAIILPYTNLDGAIVLVRNMQAAIADLKIAHASHLTLDRVTLSFGITVALPQNLPDLTELVQQADQALYQAKQAGRDRYAIVPTTVCPSWEG
jgi:diguanylate cyclase (GGDEF)-like protein/PAS domain S-box-containing protein